ncbi:hypothetical protein AgCh_015903 [Apium graveolens]
MLAGTSASQPKRTKRRFFGSVASYLTASNLSELPKSRAEELYDVYNIPQGGFGYLTLMMTRGSSTIQVSHRGMETVRGPKLARFSVWHEVNLTKLLMPNLSEGAKKLYEGLVKATVVKFNSAEYRSSDWTLVSSAEALLERKTVKASVKKVAEEAVRLGEADPSGR